MGLRHRKNLLITALKGRALGGKMKPAEIAQFELMYRRARTQEEQDQVTSALQHFLNGWKDDGDAFSRLLRAANDLDDFLDEDDDRLPPALEAAIARAKVDVTRGLLCEDSGRPPRPVWQAHRDLRGHVPPYRVG